jgi:hypothetical protein
LPRLSGERERERLAAGRLFSRASR